MTKSHTEIEHEYKEFKCNIRLIFYICDLCENRNVINVAKNFHLFFMHFICDLCKIEFKCDKCGRIFSLVLLTFHL